MANLEELDLSGNTLSFLPAPLATSLRRLRRLTLDRNAFLRLPQACPITVACKDALVYCSVCEATSLRCSRRPTLDRSAFARCHRRAPFVRMRLRSAALASYIVLTTYNVPGG